MIGVASNPVTLLEHACCKGSCRNTRVRADRPGSHDQRLIGVTHVILLDFFLLNCNHHLSLFYERRLAAPLKPKCGLQWSSFALPHRKASRRGNHEDPRKNFFSDDFTLDK